MSLNFAYNYAVIDLSTNMCIQVTSSSNPNWDDGMDDVVRIPVNDENYLMKYYNWDNGQWYEDAAFTIPWQSELI